MKQKNPETSADLAEHARPITAEDSEPESPQDNEDRTVGRRALLTRGGVVAAGVVGAGVAGVAAAGTANAATGQPVLQGSVNSVGTGQPATEIDVTNNPTTSSATPTVILTNAGGNTSTGETSPSLRLTPAGTGLVVPAAATVGGDMVATHDGSLWFTHAIPGVTSPVPAIVHTDANSTSYAPLAAPQRIVDTRTAAGRVHVIDRAGKFDSIGRLLKGKTIHLDLTTLVFFSDAVTANLTVTRPTAGGWLTVWSGATAQGPGKVVHAV